MVLKYIYVGVSAYSLYLCKCVCVCVCVCVCAGVCLISNHISNIKLTAQIDDINLTACCMKHKRKSWYKVPKFDICRSIVSLIGVSNVKWSPIEPKKNNKKTRQQNEQWGWRVEATRKGCWTKFEKGGLHKIGGVGTLCQLWYVLGLNDHLWSQCSWKKFI